MGQIALENMMFVASHGTYEEEKVLGGEFDVSIYVETDFDKAARNDDLSETVNYESLHLLVAHEMQKEKDSMEELAAHIIRAVKEMFPAVGKASIRLAKPKPALDELVGKAYVEMDLEGNTKVGLEGLKLFGNHGFYEEEAILGNYYILDVEASLSDKLTVASFDLGKTVSYETLFLIAQRENETPSKLLEHFGMRILDSIAGHFNNISSSNVSISKLNPPLKGKIGRSKVVVDRVFTMQCGRCKKEFSCFSKSNCWCADLKVPDFTLQSLKQQFKGCVCGTCLKEFAI